MASLQRSLRHSIPLIVAVAACATTAQRAAVRQAPDRSAYSAFNGNRRPLTRAERTNFQETSSHADVLQFIDSLKLLGARLSTGSVATTTEKRDVPYVVASRPLVTTPAAAKRLNRPIVYVQANIHAGEVEGKEALQSLLRDLLLSDRPNVLDSIVLIAVPNYNADGNEHLGPQAQNRGAQNGPERVGTRANAQRLNLNRDYVKAEAPETRGSLALFDRWDPDVFIDLHTTDGSYHGYGLTYAASLNPAAMFTGAYTRDTLLRSVRQMMRLRQGFEVYDYGNLTSNDPAASTNAWRTYEHTPRYGTNYYGLRGRIGILSEAFSHDPFARRVAATYDFVEEVLTFVAQNATDIVDLSHEADRRTTGWGTNPASSPPIPLRARMTTRPIVDAVLVEQLVSDSSFSQPGVPRGVRRTGNVVPVRMPVYATFEATLRRPLPFAYAFGADVGDAVLALLRLHGIVVDRLGAAATVPVGSFTVDSVIRSGRAFEGHDETTLAGRWQESAGRALPAGTFVVRAGQPLGILAAYLLEPESDDGLATWNFFDALIARGKEFPIVRITHPFTATMQPMHH